MVQASGEGVAKPYACAVGVDKGLVEVLDGEQEIVNSLVLLLFIPATLILLMGLLLLSALVEERILSPRALILRVARTRAASPDHAEQFVAREFERLLRQNQR
jgi:hypothetical protein